MKRILILGAISLFFSSTASTFQDGGGKSTKPPTATPKAPSAPKPKVEPRPSVGTKPKTRTNRLSTTAYTDEILLDNKGFMSSIDLSSNGKLFWTNYFTGTLGNLELNSLKEMTLLTGLKHPTTVKVKNNRVYFTEVGTEVNKFKDGSLSYFDLGTNRVYKLLDSLDYPNGLWITASGDIYFTEAGGSSTSFGGVEQVCILRKDTSNKVVISKANNPESVVVDESNQIIFVSSMGSSSPGETGTLAGFTMDGGSNTIFLTKLSSPHDMTLDQDGNIYIAGWGEKNGHFTGIAVSLIGNRSEWLPLKKGVFVNSLTVSENGDIYYSTSDTTGPKLRVLRLRRPSARPAREEERRALPRAPMHAANTKANPMAGIGLPLRDFEFDVVTVNSSAAETSRRKGQAQYCTEESAGMSLELVAVPGGTFLMGSTEHDTEKPPHQVTVGSFYLGKYEVTQTQWRQVASLPKVAHDLNSDPSSFKGDNLPVEQVSWEDAVEFCARLSRATGRSYRLPTEAEWEYACRAGTTTPFAFGQTITPQLVNYDGNHPYAQAPKGTYRETTTPVGFMGVANGFGLFDMHGNVGEWCMDYWHENYSGAPADGSSWETAGDTGNRVLRGGSWLLTASNARSACRYNFTPDFRSLNYGFRVVAVVRTP